MSRTATLTRLSTNPDSLGPQSLRTDSVTGFTIEVPEVGKGFTIWSDQPLDKSATIRMVSTSAVAEILHKTEDRVVFRTRNSRYELVFFQEV